MLIQKWKLGSLQTTVLNNNNNNNNNNITNVGRVLALIKKTQVEWVKFIATGTQQAKSSHSRQSINCASLRKEPSSKQRKNTQKANKKLFNQLTDSIFRTWRINNTYPSLTWDQKLPRRRYFFAQNGFTERFNLSLLAKTPEPIYSLGQRHLVAINSRVRSISTNPTLGSDQMMAIHVLPFFSICIGPTPLMSIGFISGR